VPCRDEAGWRKGGHKQGRHGAAGAVTLLQSTLCNKKLNTHKTLQSTAQPKSLTRYAMCLLMARSLSSAVLKFTQNRSTTKCFQENSGLHVLREATRGKALSGPPHRSQPAAAPLKTPLPAHGDQEVPHGPAKRR
jgi:hypothetical protein